MVSLVNSAWRLAQEAIYIHGAVQKAAELASLIQMIRRRSCSNRVLEIGTQEGGTLWTWMQLASDDATIVSVDIDQSRNVLRRGRKQQKVYFIEGDSHDLATQAQVHNRLGGKVDLLFIDGDHTYGGVLEDYMVFSCMVRPRGMIVLHDIAPSYHPKSHVDKFWTEIKTPSASEYIDPNPVTIRGDVVLPAASCGIGVLFC